MSIRHHMRLPSMVSLAAVLSTVAAGGSVALASAASQVITLADASHPCGRTGELSGSATVVCTYKTVGSDTFTVPDGVSSVDITVVGARGGHYFIAGDAAHGGSPAGDINGRPGGGGGQATGTLPGLTPGQVLQVDVAARGVDGTAASRSGA